MSYEADHPAPAELLEVYLGTLAPDDRDPIEEHLSKCSECAQTVLDFEAFPNLPPVGPEDAKIRTLLEDQKRRLIERSREEASREQRRDRETPSKRNRIGLWLASPAVAWAVAALFFVATVGLVVWDGEMYQDGLGQYFEETVKSTRGDEEPLRIVLEGGRSRVRLLLLRPGDFPEYRVILRREQTGAVVNSKPGFRPQEGSNSLDVTVPHRIVAPGFYRFEVEGIGSDKDKEPYVGFVRVQFIEASEMQTRTE